LTERRVAPRFSQITLPQSRAAYRRSSRVCVLWPRSIPAFPTPLRRVIDHLTYPSALVLVARATYFLTVKFLDNLQSSPQGTSPLRSWLRPKGSPIAALQPFLARSGCAGSPSMSARAAARSGKLLASAVLVIRVSTYTGHTPCCRGYVCMRIAAPVISHAATAAGRLRWVVPGAANLIDRIRERSRTKPILLAALKCVALQWRRPISALPSLRMSARPTGHQKISIASLAQSFRQGIEIIELPGRRGRYRPRPPQCRTCSIRASGSSRVSFADGVTDARIGRCAHRHSLIEQTFMCPGPGSLVAGLPSFRLLHVDASGISQVSR
jgi:hypothetical protein